MGFEVKFFFMYIITMTFLTLLLSSFFPASQVTEIDRQQYINDATQDYGYLASTAISSVLSSSINTMDLFGIDFIGVIENIPAWIVSIITLYSIMSTMAILFYFVKILWIG